MKYKGGDNTNGGALNPSIDYLGSADELELANWINLSSYRATHSVGDHAEKTVNLEIKGNRVWMITRASTHRSNFGGSWITGFSRIKIL